MMPMSRRDAIITAVIFFVLLGLGALIFPGVIAPLFLMALGVLWFLARLFLNYRAYSFFRLPFLGIERWSEKFADKHPRIALYVAGPIVVFFACFVLLYLPYLLWSAWHSGVIKNYRRYAPDITYNIRDDPMGFWMTFGTMAFVAIVFWFFVALLAWLLWSTRHLPKGHVRRSQPPMEDTSIGAKRTRLRIDER